ncbi:arylesterase [Nafulsella turpanensis]|uniref:arylesterase n=1 Tax=Nafulsella turpanensis TaxID=1265690 RepID=UPI00034C9C33|nr:arylesterase [Nafulsella turpanensis]
MNFKLNNILWLCICGSLLFACGENSGEEQAVKEETPVSTEAAEEAEVAEEKKVILFFGNSLTAGYGLDDLSNSFPSLIQDRLDSLGYDYTVVNAGLSGETTASGNNRLEWVLERQPVDIFVLELGANDGLRGIDPAETRRNLSEMIDKVRKAYPEAEIILAGMMVPPNMGQTYSEEFRRIYPELAEEKNVELIPFLLEDVAGEPALNQSDGIHPNAEGNEIVAENVWEVLKEELEKPGRN